MGIAIGELHGDLNIEATSRTKPRKKETDCMTCKSEPDNTGLPY